MSDLGIKVNKFVRHLRFIRSPLLVKRILHGYLNTAVLGRETLRSIELAITYQCQASCHKCYSANLQEKARRYLTVEQIKGIMAQAMRLGLIHVNITGGEPTLRKDVEDIIRACRPREIMVSLVSNALILTNDRLKGFKEAGLNTLQLSLDSSDRQTHDTLRGVPGCFDRVMEAAAWARELGINLCFSTVLSTEDSSDKSEIRRLLKLAEREKAFLLICDSAVVGRWESKSEVMMTCEARNRALAELMKHPLARHHSMYNFRMKAGCPAGTEKIYITAYGEVTPCDLVHDSFGNVLETDLEMIWRRMCGHSLYSRKMSDCVRYLEDFKYRNAL
jgi:MoaA/NifB/PqqE/SkfB family radical SAM enzyme